MTTHYVEFVSIPALWFGQDITRAREEIDMSIKRLSKLTGISGGTIHNIERGCKPLIHHHWAVALCKHLELCLDGFIAEAKKVGIM